MLVLSRKAGEKIVIGSGIEIIVTEICGNHVRIGVRAPSEVPIHREEVHHRINMEQDLVPFTAMETMR